MNNFKEELEKRIDYLAKATGEQIFYISRTLHYKLCERADCDIRSISIYTEVYCGFGSHNNHEWAFRTILEDIEYRTEKYRPGDLFKVGMNKPEECLLVLTPEGYYLINTKSGKPLSGPAKTQQSEISEEQLYYIAGTRKLKLKENC